MGTIGTSNKGILSVPRDMEMGVLPGENGVRSGETLSIVGEKRKALKDQLLGEPPSHKGTYMMAYGGIGTT